MNDQEQQLNVLAQAMIQLQQLSSAAEQGNQQAQAVMQEIQKRAQAMMQQAQGAQMAKCGAKLKKKGEKGLKLVKKAECGCKQLKRVGGKLVNVDCSGNIIGKHQGGGVIIPPVATITTPTQPRANRRPIDEFGNPVQQNNDGSWLEGLRDIIQKAPEAVKLIRRNWQNFLKKGNDQRKSDYEQWKRDQYYNPLSPFYNNRKFEPTLEA